MRRVDAPGYRMAAPGSSPVDAPSELAVTDGDRSYAAVLRSTARPDARAEAGAAVARRAAGAAPSAAAVATPAERSGGWSHGFHTRVQKRKMTAR
eukprot:365683-Chlamydomonas_euryale.AAC.4